VIHIKRIPDTAILFCHLSFQKYSKNVTPMYVQILSFHLIQNALNLWVDEECVSQSYIFLISN